MTPHSAGANADVLVMGGPGPTCAAMHAEEYFAALRPKLHRFTVAAIKGYHPGDVRSVIHADEALSEIASREGDLKTELRHLRARQADLVSELRGTIKERDDARGELKRVVSRFWLVLLVGAVAVGILVAP